LKVKVASSKNPILRLALEEIADKIGSDFDFIILAVSPKYPFSDVSRVAPVIFNVDCSQCIAFSSIDAFSNTEIVSEGVVATVFKFERKGKIKLSYFSELSGSGFDRQAKELFNKLSFDCDCVNVILGDYSDGKFPFVIRSLSTLIEKEDVPVERVCGGIFSTFIEGKKKEKGYMSVEGRIISGGFLALTFEGFDSTIGLSTGAFKAGPVYSVDRALGYEILFLDGKPAGLLPKRILSGIGEESVEPLWYTPLVVLNGDGQPVALRTFKSFTETSIEVWAPVESGVKVKLSLVVVEEILKDTEFVARRVKEKIGFADVCFDFSCAARQVTLEDKAQEELIIYGREIDAPLFGFFTHGEIAPDLSGRRLELHNQTSVCLVMREL